MRRRDFDGGSIDRFGQLGAVLALAGIVLGCGGDESKNERVASMVATPTGEPGEPGSSGATAHAGPPVVEAIEIIPRRPVAGRRLTAKVRLGSGGAAGSEVAYQWRTGSGRVLAEGRELDTTGLEAGTTVEIAATPTMGEQVGETFTHRFKLADPAKQIALVVIDAREGKHVGSTLRAVVETSADDDGFDVASLEWRVGGRAVGDGETLDTAPFAPGDLVELRARLSGEGERPIPSEPIVLERSAAPAIKSAPTSGVEGGIFRYAVEASSPARGAKLRFKLLKGPEGMKVDPETGVIEWRPSVSQRGRFDVEVAAMDQWGSGVAQRFAIHADPQGAPPASPR